MTEDEMVGWYHQLNGHEFRQALVVGLNFMAAVTVWSDFGAQENNLKLTRLGS